MFLQGLYAALLSWRNSHVESTWSWYMMWPGEIFFRFLEQSKFWSVWSWCADGDLWDCIISPIAIYAIVFFCRSQFTRSCYFVDRKLRDRVIFSWSRVRTPAKQYHNFNWSWVWFPGQIACFRPVWFMTYVTCRNKWWIRVMKKNLMGGKKCKVTLLSVRLWWRGRLSLVGT